MNDIEIEDKILEILQSTEEISSNQVYRKLGVNKARYTIIRDKMIKEEWIRLSEKNGRKYLAKTNIDIPKFYDYDPIRIARINCKTYLESMKTNRPLFIKKNEKYEITEEMKMVLNAFFHELDRQMILHIRLVNAEALGIIKNKDMKYHQKRCVEFVQARIKILLKDHSEFREEIKDFAQSKIRMLEFKI